MESNGRILVHMHPGHGVYGKRACKMCIESRSNGEYIKDEPVIKTFELIGSYYHYLHWSWISWLTALNFTLGFNKRQSFMRHEKLKGLKCDVCGEAYTFDTFEK